MFVPFISSRQLFRRKGGGGGGGKGSLGGKASSSSGTIKSPSSSKTGSISKGTTTTRSNSYTPPKTIPAGQPFAGRSEGGSSRSQIFGTRAYGSGYPSYSSPGVYGRGFPFYFWPIVWAVPLIGGAYYLYHEEDEYGLPSNSTRPGGALVYATFPSASSSPPSVIFRIVADNATVMSLIPDLTANCTTYMSNSSSPPNSLSTTSTAFTPPYTFSNVTGPANPQPEQVIQYYRASTLSLTLDLYNNTATYAAEGTPDSPLPALRTSDAALLVCLNTTIGLAAPLVGSGRPTAMADIPLPTFFVFWFVWWMWELMI